MTDAAMTDATIDGRRIGLLSPRGRVLPVMVVVCAIVVLWYVLATALNWAQVEERMSNDPLPKSVYAMVSGTWSMERPVLPAPHQVLEEFWKTTFEMSPTSKRSLVYHAWITASATMLGFAFGAILGMLLAAGIVHVRTLDRSLMPWVIASQTVPILAIAPMIIVILGSVGMVGLVPKAIISMYLCFFPVTIGMVKGLRSPDPLQLDLMRTYSASAWQVFWKLRMPASIPFLFASMKVAIAISLVGTIVGELPTGANGGIGARLLAGSYYGQTVQIWSALLMGSLLGAAMVYLMGSIERVTLRRMGAPR
ncbi:MAG TPA: ABC transporter permease [Dongiaceae bacterium]|jgi:NitT/TauT family transport system permease protein|nr:ABC transporter permease [Dongiaceae bacterium]